MRRYDDSPEDAETEIRRANDASFDADAALHEAEELAERIEQENPQTPEEEGDVVARMEAVQREIERLKEEAADAEQHVFDTAASWGL